MRWLKLLPASLMCLFAAVQYNDPDGLLWFAFYGAAALVAGLAAWRPVLWRRACVRRLHIGSIVAAAVFACWLLPDIDDWWRREIWWEVEAVREAMGAMIVALVLAIVFASTGQRARTTRS